MLRNMVAEAAGLTARSGGRVEAELGVSLDSEEGGFSPSRRSTSAGIPIPEVTSITTRTTSRPPSRRSTSSRRASPST